MAVAELIGPTLARRLGLPDPEDRVAVFLTAGLGAASLVHVSSLRARLIDIPDTVELVVLAVGDTLDLAAQSQIAAMVGAMGDEDAMACAQAVSDALKEVGEGLVVRGVDRSDLVTASGPEVIRLSSLKRALTRAPDEQRASLTGLIAATGGRVSLFEAS